MDQITSQRMMEMPRKTYRHTYVACPEGLEAWDWRWLVEEYQQRLIAAFPSLKACDSTIDGLKETRALARSSLVAFTLSYKDGMVALSIIPMRGAVPAFAERWVDKIAARWRELVAKLWGPAYGHWGYQASGSPIFHKIPPPTVARCVGHHTY